MDAALMATWAGVGISLAAVTANVWITRWSLRGAALLRIGEAKLEWVAEVRAKAAQYISDLISLGNYADQLKNGTIKLSSTLTEAQKAVVKSYNELVLINNRSDMDRLSTWHNAAFAKMNEGKFVAELKLSEFYQIVADLTEPELENARRNIRGKANA